MSYNTSVPGVPPTIGGVAVVELSLGGTRGQYAVPVEAAVKPGGPSLFRKVGSEWLIMARFEGAAGA
jgi:hypothetical protein